MGSTFNNWAGSTYAEKQRDKYKKLYSTLESKISSIDENLPYVESAIRELHSYYTVNPDSAKGQMATTFVTKENEFYTKCLGIYRAMNTALADLNTKKEEAKSRYDYWDNQCRLEEQERIRKEQEALKALMDLVKGWP